MQSSSSSSLTKFSHQVGGHGISTNEMEMDKCILSSQDFIYKPLQSGGRGHKEALKYANWFDEEKNKDNALVIQFRSFLATYHGIQKQIDPSDQTEKEYLCLENLTKNFTKPCVLDLKMGTKTYAPYANQMKKDREDKKYPIMKKTGFRFVGMQIYDVDNDINISHDKDYGYSMKIDEFPDGIKRFCSSGIFNGGSEEEKRKLLVKIIGKLTDIKEWFENQNLHRFYSSSLLLVYEGDVTAGSSDTVTIKLIDFAHVCDIKEKDGLDDGYLLGLNHIVRIFNNLLDEHS